MVLQRKYAETKRRKNKSLKTVTIARRFGALRPRVKTRSFEEIPFALSGTAKRFFRASQPSQRERPGPTGKRAETTPAKKALVTRRLPLKRRRFTNYPMIKRS